MQRDFSTKPGAEALKRKLEEYYRQRGEEYEFRIEPVHGIKNGGRTVYSVKSTIKFGAPK